MLTRIKKLLFHNSTIRQTVAKNTFWLSISDFGGRFLRAAVIIYAARVLGTAEWGVFSYAISFVTFVTVFTDIGINPLIVREASRATADPLYRKKLLSTSLLFKAALTITGVLAVSLIGPRITAIEGVRLILPLAIFIFAFDSIRNFGYSIIRSIEKMEIEAFLNILMNAAIVTLGFIFLGISSTVFSFTFAYVLGTGIGTLLTLYALRGHLSGIFSHFSFPVLKLLISSGWPLAISNFLGMLMINTDILIIGWLLSASDVGLYSAAQRIVQLLYLVPGILTMSLLPVLSRLARENTEKLTRMLELVLSFTFFVAIPIAVGGIILGEPIMELVFGSEYLPATISFQILLATILIDFPVVILSNVAFAYNRQKSLIAYSAIGGVSNIILDLILIPWFGIAGSAWATFFAQLISVFYLQTVVRTVTNPKVFRNLSKVIISTCIMAVAVLLSSIIGLHVVLSVVIGMIVYFGFLFQLKEPLLREIKAATRT